MNRGTLKTYSRILPKRTSKTETVSEDEDDSPGSPGVKEVRHSSPSPSTSKTKGSKSPRSKSSKQKEESSTLPEGEKHKGWVSPRSSSRRRKSSSSPHQTDGKHKSMLENKKLKKDNTPRRNVKKGKKVSPRLANQKRKGKDSPRVSSEEEIPVTENEKSSSPLLTSKEEKDNVLSKLSTEKEEEEDARGTSEEREDTVNAHITVTKTKGKYRPKPASKKSNEICHSESENEEDNKDTTEENQEDELEAESKNLSNPDANQKVVIPSTLTTESLIKVLEDDSDEDNLAGIDKVEKKAVPTDEDLEEKYKNGQPIKDAFVKLIRIDTFLKNMIKKKKEAKEKERLKRENNEAERKRKIESDKKNLDKKGKSETEKKNKVERDVKETDRKRGRPRKSKIEDPSVEIPLADVQVSATPTFSMQTRKRKLKFRLDGSLVKSDDEDQRLPSDSDKESETLSVDLEKSQRSQKLFNKYKQKSKQTKIDKSNFDFATYYKDRASGKFDYDNKEHNVEQKKYVAERDSIEPALKLLSTFMNMPIIPADVVHETYKVNEESAVKLPKVIKKGDIRPNGPRVEKNFSPYIYEDSQDYIMLSCAEELFQEQPQEGDSSEEETSDEEDMSPSATLDGSVSLVNSPLVTVKELISRSIKGMDGWNVTMIKGSSALFIGLIAIGRMGMPILKKSVQIDDNFSARVFIHQLHCKRYDGIYNTIDSILSLIKEVDSLVA